MNQYSSHTLSRTGDRPLTFSGELLSEADSQTHQGPCQNRWWELALYRSESGKFVAHIHYKTQWQGEHNTDTVLHADDAADLAAQIKAHNFLGGCYGFPRGHDDRQTQLINSLTACWQKAVGELLSVTEPEKI